MSMISTDITTGISIVDNMPIVDENDPLQTQSPNGNHQPPTGYACYDASICAILNAVIADANNKITPRSGSRTLTWENITASRGIPVEINRFAYQLIFGGTPNALYYPEFLADLGPLYQLSTTEIDPYNYGKLPLSVVFTSNHGATFRDFVTSNTTHITNQYVIDLMNKDFGVMVGFIWTTPSATGDVVTLTLGETHKLVFSGYRAGTYPLRVNNTFDKGQQWVRLLPLNQATRPLGTIGLGPANIDPDSLAAVFEAGFGNFYLEWETSPQPDTPLCIIGQLDAFSLNWPAPQRVFTATWGTWTHLIGLPNTDILLAYNSATGDISFANVSPRGAVTVWQRAWIKRFTHLMPFNMGSQNYLLTYSSVTGAVQYGPIAANLPGPPASPGDWSGHWGPGFTNFMPFTIQDEPHFLAYNASTGLVHLDRIAANLEGSATRFEATWGLGWTHFLSMTFEDQPHYIAYNQATGDMQIVNINTQSGVGGAHPGNDLFLNFRYSGKWPTGYTNIEILTGEGMPHYLAYDSSAQAINFGRMRIDASGTDRLWVDSLPSGFTITASFLTTNQLNYFILYNPTSGAAEFYEATTF